LRRELAELALIESEATTAAAARGRVAAELAIPIAAPRTGSLHRPVARSQVVGRFGEYRDRGVRLIRRGIELSARAGRNVRAVEAGTIRFCGPLRGLGTVVVAEHAGYMSVLGRLDAVKVTPGQVVARGEAIAEAAGDRVYLEIRAGAGRGGFPLDPSPLID
jgi:septal ring factor EnvC (AmiA/AmiB activator)